MNKQLAIPGLDPPPQRPKVKAPDIRRQIIALENRVLELELEAILLRKREGSSGNSYM